MHKTKKVPGRLNGMVRTQGEPGDKLTRRVFNGMCTIRGHVGVAGRLALEGKLGKKMTQKLL